MSRTMLVALFLLATMDCARAREIEIVADGTSQYVIAVAEEAERRRIGEAADFLQQTILRSTGVRLPVATESAVAQGTPAIYLGWSRAARQAGIDVEGVKGWSYLNRAVGRDIFLVGEDRKTRIAPGPRPRTAGVYGSFKAVTAFLDDQMEVRFLMPGEYGMRVPKLSRFVVDADMDITWSPIFKYVGGRMANYYRRHEKNLGDTAFGFASHMFGASEFLYDYGGHSYYHAVPEEKYWKTNPEYFAEVGGVRKGKGNHLCISNPEVQELMLKEMERQLDRGFEWVELEQTDGYIPCECEACEAIHPDAGERVWIVHRKLAAEMRRSRPGKMVMIASYGPTRLPPKSFKTFPDNVAIRLTRYRPRDFEMWKEWGGEKIPKSLYTTNWLTAHPRISPYVAVHQTRLFVKNNLKGMYLCGGIIQNSKGNWYPWGLGGPGYYAFFKSLHNPEVDPTAMRAEYVSAAFGEAAAPMQNFFASLDSRMDHYWSLYRTDPQNSPPTRMMATAADFNAHFYPPRMLKTMSASLERALELAQDERVKARLKLVALEFDYLKRRAIVYHLYRAYRLVPSFETLALLEAKVKDFYDTRARIWPDGEPTRIRGVPSPFSGTATKLGRGAAKSAPFNWDFALLRAKRVLPGVGMKRTQAERVDPFTIDGRIDRPVWKGIPWETIGEIAMGKAPSGTLFKVAYDEASLYVAFKGGLTSPTVLDGLTPVGRDGVAWRQENMELVIDPLGTRRMYYHFIINPLPNSSLERRFGYFQAPDHPLYQKFEWDWRGDWEYRAHIDKERKLWTAELRIPFETLGGKQPKAGDIWALNVGRNEYGPKSKRNKGGLIACYLWSPNIESKTFHDMSTFGELVFR